MLHEGFTPQHRTIGKVAAWAVFSLGIVYAVVTVLGFLSLKSPLDPIGDPFVSIMELLIIPLTLFYVVSMVAVHAYAPPEDKAYSFMALCLMTLVAGISSSVHFVILTVGHQIEASRLAWVSLFFSWKWPSVAYALDTLAWDWFFALSMLFAAAVFKKGKLEMTVRILMSISGVLSLAGLIGVSLADMQIRNIGIIGYAVVAPVAFLLLGIVFGRTKHEPSDTE